MSWMKKTLGAMDKNETREKWNRKTDNKKKIKEKGGLLYTVIYRVVIN